MSYVMCSVTAVAAIFLPPKYPKTFRDHTIQTNTDSTRVLLVEQRPKMRATAKTTSPMHGTLSIAGTTTAILTPQATLVVTANMHAMQTMHQMHSYQGGRWPYMRGASCMSVYYKQTVLLADSTLGAKISETYYSYVHIVMVTTEQSFLTACHLPHTHICIFLFVAKGKSHGPKRTITKSVFLVALRTLYATACLISLYIVTVVVVVQHLQRRSGKLISFWSETNYNVQTAHQEITTIHQ